MFHVKSCLLREMTHKNINAKPQLKLGSTPLSHMKAGSLITSPLWN